jgi:hypothetical protein
MKLPKFLAIEDSAIITELWALFWQCLVTKIYQSSSEITLTGQHPPRSAPFPGALKLSKDTLVHSDMRTCTFTHPHIHTYTLSCFIVLQVPPVVEYCPGDLWVIAKNGSALVRWDEPVFNDNVGIIQIERKDNHSPGQTLMWGTYTVAYVAYDRAGNSATCSFKVYVLGK